MLNSKRNAFDTEFYEGFLNSCKDIVDVIHGNHKNSSLSALGIQHYEKDISQWVYGYILGVEWESDIVAFTNETGPQLPDFEGEYLYTEAARNFEIFLAMIGDGLIEYETEKYAAQRTVAFSNWPTTGPLEFNENISRQFKKYAQIDVENILSTEKFQGGQYASYHIYPYYPEYVLYEESLDIQNTYKDYLIMLNEHHSMPVVISEFGVPSSRAKASYENNRELGRDQGQLNETEQGEAIVSLYDDIMQSGCAGGIVFIWQDEWFKKTWNTLATVNLDNNALWSDYQTNEQSFGLLSFDPGDEESICYVDGDKSDWEEKDLITTQNEYAISMKYDVKFMYFLAEKDGFDIADDKLYIPIDTTPKSGATSAEDLNIAMTDEADFIIEIDGIENSRVWVHERYNTTQVLYGTQIQENYNPYQNVPEPNTTEFSQIKLILHELDYYDDGIKIPVQGFDIKEMDEYYFLVQTYETGKLTYGNANPQSADFNSLADFCAGDGFVEMKIPWGLLNFADPSQMEIHDDYYENYGVEYIKIDHMNVGLGDGTATIEMEPFPLEKLGRNPEYHERLKESYYILQNHWMSN